MSFSISKNSCLNQFKFLFNDEIKIISIDGKKISDKSELFNVFSEKLNFPSYFGNNWDALNECIKDMSWSSAKGYVLIFNNSVILKKNQAENFEIMQNILFDAQKYWNKLNIPFVLVYL